MELKDVLLGGGGLLLAVMTLIQIAPVKIDPWSAIGKAIGRAINGELIAKVDKLEKDIEERNIRNARTRILRFGDEIRRDIIHSKEHFDDVLEDISEYELYCSMHKDFKNERLRLTAKLIMNTYENCLKDDSFI